MAKKFLKKSTSLALALAVVLSLSCCGVGDEILIDEIPTETTSEAAETTSETTEELTADETTYETTTEEMTETTTEETEEVTSEETSLTIPDEETILASLSDEEKEVWLSMPDIVTMRVLSRYDEEEEEICTEFLYNEIIYIDKMGQVKKFITYDDYTSPDDDIIVAWLSDQISQNEDAELANVADIHKLLKFYNTFMCIDSDSQRVLNYTVGVSEEFNRHYYFRLYGIRNSLKNGLETLLLSKGNAGRYYVPRNYTDEGEPRDESGRKTFDLYLKLDPFMVKGGGGYGHLIDEEV